MNERETRDDRVALVASLGLPANAAAPAHYIDEGMPLSAAGLAALVDDEVTAHIWRRWHPAQAGRVEDAAFLAALRDWLADAAAMGYELDGFRDAVERLPAPVGNDDAWVAGFEQAVAAANRLLLRVFVNRAVRDAFVAGGTDTQASESWTRLKKMMRDGLFYELGIVLPDPALMVDDALESGELRIEVNDARLPRMALIERERLLVNDTVERLALIGVHGEATVNPANGSPCAIIDAADGPRCEKAGLTTWTQMGHAIITLSAVARSFAGAFVNTYLADHLLDTLGQAYPVAVQEARRVVPVETLARVLRALVDENISIRDLLRILEVLALAESVVESDSRRMIVFDPPALERMQVHQPASALDRSLVRLRASMKRYISNKHARGSNTLVVYLLDPDIEAWLDAPDPLSGVDRAGLVDALRDELDRLPASALKPAILTLTAVRRRLWREIAAALPGVVVLAYSELSPELNIQPVARIAMPARPPGEQLGHAAPPSSGDPVLDTLRAHRASLMRTARAGVRWGARTERLMPRCLDAMLARLAGADPAPVLATALSDVENRPTAYEHVVDMILRLGGKAAESLHEPEVDETEAWRGHLADLARVRDAARDTARTAATMLVQDRVSR